MSGKPDHIRIVPNIAYDGYTIHAGERYFLNAYGDIAVFETSGDAARYVENFPYRLSPAWDRGEAA